MIVWKNVVAFEWDSGNIDKNVKHKVEDKESEEPFFDKKRIMLEDTKHSRQEKRYLLLGKTKKGRKLSLIYTLRKSKIRVISARDMNKKERRLYEEQSQKNTTI